MFYITMFGDYKYKKIAISVDAQIIPLVCQILFSQELGGIFKLDIHERNQKGSKGTAKYRTLS